MFLSLKLRDPADQLKESKAAPARKVKQESPGESPQRSRPADPPKRVKNEFLGDSAESKNHQKLHLQWMVHADLEENGPRESPLAQDRQKCLKFH